MLTLRKYNIYHYPSSNSPQHYQLFFRITMAANTDESLPEYVRKNMKRAMYKRCEKSLPAHVVSAVTVKDLVFVGTLHFGCLVYRVSAEGISRLCHLGQQPRTDKSRSSRATPTGGCSCYNLVVQGGYVGMFKLDEADGSWWLCVHRLKSLAGGDTKPISSAEVKCKAPFVIEPKLGLLAVSGSAWKSSWVSGDGSGQETDLGDDRCVKVLDLQNLNVQQEWKAVSNKVAIMKLQMGDDLSLMGVSDIRSGLKVYDLRQPKSEGYVCMYDIPVEEIRTFEFAGDFITVFHKFDYNISLWNMQEQKTILCIDIQDQLRQIAEEYYAEDDDDSGLCEEEEDHVTCVTCIPFEGESLLIYGLKSGCILGVKVQSRSKVFSIPYPFEMTEANTVKREVQGIGYVRPGRIAVVYDKWGLTILDFTPETPPDRPPTRGNQQ